MKNYVDPIGNLDWEKEYIEDAIPLHELVPKGMTFKEYFGKKQRLLRGENISYMKFDKDGYQ
jgi:hypothetical protein